MFFPIKTLTGVVKRSLMILTPYWFVFPEVAPA
jgi:hypothetical protein